MQSHVPGLPGVPGQDGADGRDGAPGLPGAIGKKNQQKKKDLSIHFQFYFRVVVHEKWPQALLEHLARAEPTEHPDRTAATESLDHPVRKVIDFFVKLNFKLS